MNGQMDGEMIWVTAFSTWNETLSVVGKGNLTRLKIPRITTIKTTKTVTSGHNMTQISNHVPQKKKMREEMGKEGRWVGVVANF